MKIIRILSDLHIDINKKYPLSWKDKDTFTVLAGDTCGDPKTGANWINRHFKNGIVISGNHLVYNDRNLTIQELREIYAKAFPKKASMTYLDCLAKNGVFTKEVDGILFVGSTLYTDFNLKTLNCISKEDNLYWAKCYSNDYRWGTIQDDKLKSVRRLRPEDLEQFFKITIAKFKEVIEQAEKEDPTKSIVVVTHYTPSEKCIQTSYVDSELVASYASNLEQFILDHKNIKLWICGHSHTQTNFKIGDCLVVMNPRGYCRDFQDRDFDKDLCVDTSTWEVVKHEKSEEDKREFEERSKNSLAAWAAFF